MYNKSSTLKAICEMTIRILYTHGSKLWWAWSQKAICPIIPSKVHGSLTIWTSHLTDVGFWYGDERDHLSEGLLESECGWNGEGMWNLRSVVIKLFAKYHTIWKVEWCPRSHNPYAYNKRWTTCLLVKRYGGPQTLLDVPGCWRSAIDLILLLVGVCECHSWCHAGWDIFYRLRPYN